MEEFWYFPVKSYPRYFYAKIQLVNSIWHPLYSHYLCAKIQLVTSILHLNFMNLFFVPPKSSYSSTFILFRILNFMSFVFATFALKIDATNLEWRSTFCPFDTMVRGTLLIAWKGAQKFYIRINFSLKLKYLLKKHDSFIKKKEVQTFPSWPIFEAGKPIPNPQSLLLLQLPDNLGASFLNK